MRLRSGMGAAFALLVGGSRWPLARRRRRTNRSVVCKHGCDYRTIQDAVERLGKNATISVEPGKYKEGVIVDGHKHDGLTIEGTGKNPKKVILEGKNAKTDDGSRPTTGSRAIDVNDLHAAEHVGAQLRRQRVLHPRRQCRKPATTT